MLEKLAEVIKPKNRNKEDFQLTFDSPHPTFLALFRTYRRKCKLL